MGTSLVAQWVRLRAPNAGGPGSIPGRGIRTRMPQLSLHAATTEACTPRARALQGEKPPQ